MRACLLLAWALAARLAVGSSLQVAMIVQGSDFINVDLVPTLSVSQFDLGDVFLSPCRAGSFSADHSGVCKPCSVCIEEEYQTYECLTYQDRVCANCTACTERQVELCPCGNITGQCYTGNRVCTPLVSMSVTLRFKVYASVSLNTMQQRFLEQGLATGFVLYLAGLLNQPVDNILMQPVVSESRKVFSAAYILTDVYRPDALAILGSWSDDRIQTGLGSTFGQGSNTFATRRRLLAQSPFLSGEGSEVSCMPTTSCGTFFVTTLTVSGNCTVATCTALPCPAGYRGDFGLCDPCLNATFKPTVGADPCTACPSGYTSDSASVSQGQCRLLVIPTTTPAPTSSSATAGKTSSRPATTSGSTGQSSPSAGQSLTTAGQPGPAVTSPGQPAPAVTSPGQPGPAVTSPGPPQQPTSPGPPPPATSPGPPPPPPYVNPPPSGSGGIYVVNHNERSVVINYQESDPWAMVMMGGVLGCGSVLLVVLWSRLHPEGWQYTLLPQAPRRVIPRSIVVQGF
jgi:hypothetical protein